MTPHTPAPERMMRHIGIILSGLLCLLAMSCSAFSSRVEVRSEVEAKAELARKVAHSREPAVLFVGNSYSFGVPKAFIRLAESRGKEVRVGLAAHNGWSLAKHAANDETLAKIREGNWDIVVIQEHSRIPSLAPGKAAARMHPPLAKLVSEARNGGAVPVLYQTWGRRDGDATVGGDDFTAMNRRLRAGYDAASASAGGLVVARVGDAWGRSRTGEGHGILFMPDGSHPSPAGDRLTAEVFYQCIFGK